MPKQLRETATIRETTASSGRMLVQFITPGWGSSGYYSPEVLQEAATNRIIPAGTHMYADHPTTAEAQARPERSIRDLIAVTLEDARLAEDGALVGEVQVFSPYQDLLSEMADAIGVSIRGSATDITTGEAEGRRGSIIEGLARVDSVDFVTRAGRGGRVLQLLESERTNRRAIAHGIDEATVNDTREQLHHLIVDAYGGENTWCWVRDFDETTVWFEVETQGESGGDSGLFQQAYETDQNGASALSGDRIEVRVVTTYVPATRPDGTTTEESQEDTMPNIQIEEAEHARLVEAAGRVTALEERATTAERERDEARRVLAERERADRARVLITEAADGVAFTTLEEAGLLATLPLTGDGALDEAAFTQSVKEQAAAKKKAAGAGTIHGFGSPSQTTTVVEAADEKVAAIDTLLGIKKGA